MRKLVSRILPQGDTRNAQGNTARPQGGAFARKGSEITLGPCNRWSGSRSAFALALAPLALSACAGGPEPVSLVDSAPAQRAWVAQCEDWDEWDKPGPPFRIYGDTYYVGTCGITAILVAGADGHTLIDSGTDKGADAVLANIRALGFFPQDVKTLLTSHEHFDHVGGMAKLQAATGARIVTTAAAAAVLRSGKPGADDPQATSDHPPFAPVTGPMTILTRATMQRFAGREFTPIFTPGHTPGALSWRWRDCEGTDCQSIVYADSLNPISADGYRFSDNPRLIAAMRRGLRDLARVDCEIVLAPHPAAALMRDRLSGTSPLVNRSGCRNYATTASARLDARLAAERKGG